MSNLTDMRGNTFHHGCKVVRAVGDGHLSICTVTRIENGSIYLDNSKIAIRYPKRLLIIDPDPLYNMLKQHEKSKE